MCRKPTSSLPPNWELRTWEPLLNPTVNYNFAADQDGPTILKYLSGLVIPIGVSVTTSVRNKGFFIYKW